MTAAAPNDYEIIKIEDSPSPVLSLVSSPDPSLASINAPPISDNAPVYFDSRDPEGFLKRCSGFNKKNGVRCNSVIGKKSEQSCHSTFLPTCRAHRDQQSFAGWCQYQHFDGERCGRLFRWTPPYFELCTIHQGHPDTPCYFLRLPLELRHEVFRYLLPGRAIGSSTNQLHNIHDHTHIIPPHPTLAHRRRLASYHRHVAATMSQPSGGDTCSAFPMPALDLFLVSRQFYQDAKDLLFSTVPFTIDVRKDGTFMCGRRLLEPRRADGSAHFSVEEADETKQRFLKHFDWTAVKHYVVDILVENWANGTLYSAHSTWDEEVELYDIRDYISVVVSGVLAKSRNLCKLQVRLCLADFEWTHEQTLANTKLIVGPFEHLRNVRQPQIVGIFMGKPNHNAMLTVQRPHWTVGSRAAICSVPPLPTHTPLLIPGMPDFDTYTSSWTRWVSSSSSSALTKKPPIRAMFTSFKDFYSELSAVVPGITFIQGRNAFLHRARVAREQENVEAFRHLRNELIQYWYTWLEQEERKKVEMNQRLSIMLDTDVYPSHEWQDSRTSSVTVTGSEQESNSTNCAPGKRSVPSHSDDDSAKIRSESDDSAQIQTRQPSSSTVSHSPGNRYNKFALAQVESNIDPIDVACFAHVNLSEDWFAEPGPGPSTLTKKRQRRVDSGFGEMTVDEEEGGDRMVVAGGFDGGEGKVMYVGKGKGKMGVAEVICID